MATPPSEENMINQPFANGCLSLTQPHEVNQTDKSDRTYAQYIVSMDAAVQNARKPKIVGLASPIE